MRILLTVTAIYVLCIGILWANDLIKESVIRIAPDIRSYDLGFQNFITGSEAVYADTLLLVKNRDYTLDSRRGVIILHAIPPAEFLRFSALLIPTGLADRRFLYETRAISDSLVRDIKPRRSVWDVEQGDLTISGSKSFAISFSENESFDLKQSLFVNLSGKLADDVNISARLSDSESKLSPEGDSKELSSLDQVYIRVFGSKYEIAMGDLELKFAGTRYLDHSTKFEGINARVGNLNFLQAAYSAGGGKNAEMLISIIDGKQGPYYLNPQGFQNSVLIIAGSEQIYRDGSLLERGSDYYIDYSEGTVMFRSLVTSANLIKAYFQFSDEYYRQNTLFNSSSISPFNGLNITHHVIHQADARDNPLMYELSHSDIDSLRSAGDATVWTDGAVAVEPGAGRYIRINTSEGLIYYQYAETDSTADYNVVFSFVGFGNGDYEQFSSGKFRYIGPGLGAWAPLKRLQAPTRQSNIDVAARYSAGNWNLGMEAIYTNLDKNTFSKLDDDDNQSGIIMAYTQYGNQMAERGAYAGLEIERRFANSALFSAYSNPAAEYDLSALPAADSLAATQVDLTSGISLGQAFRPRLSLRYRVVDDLYTQQAVRWSSSSRQYGILPLLNMQHTVARQSYADSTLGSSWLQFHSARATWSVRSFTSGVQLLLRELSYDLPNPLNIGTRYQSMEPFLSTRFTGVGSSNLKATFDRSTMQDDGWQQLSSSQTYALRHIYSSENQSVNAEITHREVKASPETPKTSFDLITLRNQHNFFKRALTLLANYQLNQTEFFPKIRELQYVGSGYGLYDSTGVYVQGGEWDYVFITSGTGTLSTEINAQASIFIKPGNILKSPLANRINSDISVNAVEQTEQRNDALTYLLWPGSTFNADTTIYGKQSYNQNLWLDVVPGRVTSKLRLDMERSLDNRYQEQSRVSRRESGAEIDLLRQWGYDFNFAYTNRLEIDTRYNSRVNANSISGFALRNLTRHHSIRTDMGYVREEGREQSSISGYALSSYFLKPLWRGTWGAKGRVSAGMSIQYNDRDGNDFLSFLPEKREGVLWGWNISAIYRINSFSSASLDYTGNIYPSESTRHQFKLEFKAEL